MTTPFRPTLIRDAQVAATEDLVVIESRLARRGGLAPELAARVHHAAADPLAETRRQADQLLVQAQARAEQILAEARAEAEALRLQAIAEGRAEAERAAQVALEGRVEHLLAGLAEAGREFNAFVAGLQAEGGHAAAGLATAMAERILRRSIELNPVWLAGMLQDILAPLAPLKELTIRIHPSDEPLLASCRAGLPMATGLVEVRIVADPSVAPGTLQLSYPGGDADASFATQLAALRDQIAATLQLKR